MANKEETAIIMARYKQKAAQYHFAQCPHCDKFHRQSIDKRNPFCNSVCRVLFYGTGRTNIKCCNPTCNKRVVHPKFGRKSYYCPSCKNWTTRAKSIRDAIKAGNFHLWKGELYRRAEWDALTLAVEEEAIRRENGGKRSVEFVQQLQVPDKVIAEMFEGALALQQEKVKKGQSLYEAVNSVTRTPQEVIEKIRLSRAVTWEDLKSMLVSGINSKLAEVYNKGYCDGRKGV